MTTDTGRDSKGKFASGNPGRPKGAVNKTTADVKAYLAPYVDDVVEGMLTLAIGGEQDVRLDPEDPDSKLITVPVPPCSDMKVRFWAQQELLNRVLGKPTVSVDVDASKLSIAALMNQEDAEDGDG